ncbi:MAG: RNA polymerase sigma factor [Acidobacteriota bacterium]|nr:RNA polymerase sigma factor [Acidobacteriota bacterium]
MADLRSVVDAVFRQESGRIIAGLIRVSGSFDLAEEAMQDAFAAALAHWPGKGIPDNPAAWITAAAHRKLIDYARRSRTRRDKAEELLRETQIAGIEEDPLADSAAMTFPDDRLRLIFTCCHPALNAEAQVALTLRTLGGLTTPEIAHAFLVTESTLAQRLVRAKRKIQVARIPYETPPKELLPERLDSARSVIYLIFNEGYKASAGDSLIRRELCSEAIRLGRTLSDLLPGEPESVGLLALMLLHDSRRNARVNDRGELIPLEEQRRSQWDKDQIREGLNLVEEALRLRQAGPYQLQAAIAAVHASAPAALDTDWKQIAMLYRELECAFPSAIVALNRAVAVAMSDGLETGLKQIEELTELSEYYLYHAARADILRRLGRAQDAVDAYRCALGLTANASERRYMRRRLRELGAPET